MPILIKKLLDFLAYTIVLGVFGVLIIGLISIAGLWTVAGLCLFFWALVRFIEMK